MEKTLDLYITKVCNLNCKYCYVDLIQDEQSFNLENFQKRINLLEYDHIKFFGGEPLLKWIDIKKIVELVKGKDKNIKFSIITNGLLLNDNIVEFCIKNKVEIIVSVHYKGLKKILYKVKKYSFAKNIFGFNFIFEEGKIKFPYEIIYILQKIGFINFILVPEIYSNWNEKNLEKLQIELEKLKELYIKNKNISFKGINGVKLKQLNNGCEKTIMGKKGDIFLCNRFKSLKILKKYNYKYIYEQFNKVLNLENDKNKWFYICQIGWFLDSLNLLNKIDLNKRIRQFKNLNLIFINFFKEINNINGKLNFLSESIDEIRFNLTSQCNLRCNYCYVDFKDKKLNKKIAKDIIDFYLLQDGKNKKISFFGGEPLLEFELLKELVEHSKKIVKKRNKNISFSIATNFLLVNNEIAAFLKENNFNTHISFNGKKYYNDKMRDNSTDLLLEQLEKYSDFIGKDNIVILLAFSNFEVDKLYENIRYIYKLGFKNINLEIIFGQKYLWNKEKIFLLKKELLKIKKSNIFNNLKLINLQKNGNILDISVDGKAGENSFKFNNYNVNFKIKNIFDKLINSIYGGDKNIK